MRQAVVDIGSNAIRASVYDDDTLGAPEIYNNKFKINLQRFIDTGSYDVNHSFYLIIQYFNDVFKNLGVTRMKCVATAGFRLAEKHKEFCEHLKRKYNFDIQVISGEEEARLTASGVLLGFSNPEGIVADLGGGSLELALVKNKKLGKLASIQLGSRAVKDTKNITIDRITSIISENFDVNNQKNLYLIGGGFRIIAKNYVSTMNYPLKNLHSMEILRGDISKYFNTIDAENGTKIFHDSYPTKVVRALIDVFNPEKVIISNYGVKEGIRFELLSDLERSKNVIAETTKNVTKASEQILNAIPNYRAFVKDFLVDPDASTLELIDFSLMFISMAKSIEINAKPPFLLQFVLGVDIPFTHRQRVMLSVVVFTTFRSFINPYLRRIAKRTLTKKDYVNASIIGIVMYMLSEVDGYEYSKPSFKISIGQYNQWIIDTDKILPYDIFTKVKNALKTLKKLQSCIETDQEIPEDLSD